MAKKKAVKFPCGHCSNTTSGDAALMCNICEFWHHKDCIPGMTDECYKTIISMKESLGYSFFLCNKCEKVNKKTWQSVNLLSKRVETIEKRLDDIEEKLKKSTESTENVIKEFKSVEAKSSVSSVELKTTVLSEIQDQENRKTNIVIYNLQESPAEEINTRKEHDNNKVAEILNSIGITDIGSDDIASLRRLGPRPHSTAQSNSEASVSAAPAPASKPRPLLLSFKINDHRKNVLSNARKLARSHLNIYQFLLT